VDDAQTSVEVEMDGDLKFMLDSFGLPNDTDEDFAADVRQVFPTSKMYILILWRNYFR